MCGSREFGAAAGSLAPARRHGQPLVRDRASPGPVCIMACAGATTEAAEHYQRALKLAPKYAPAAYNMGVLHSEAKQVSCCWALLLQRKLQALWVGWATGERGKHSA